MLGVLGVFGVCFASLPLDGRSTLSSLLDRLESWHRTRTRPTLPLTAFASRKWVVGESLDSYVNELKRLVRFVSDAANLQTQLLTSQFLEGLPESSRAVVLSYKATKPDASFEDLVQLARELGLSASSSVPVHTAAAIEAGVSCEGAKSQETDACACVATLHRSPGLTGVALQCWRCGRHGHGFRVCQVPSSVICRRCKRSGHVERACSLKRNSPAGSRVGTAAAGVSGNDSL